MILNVSSTRVRRRLGQLLEAVNDRRVEVVVTRSGAPAAALIDIASLDRLRKLDLDFDSMRRDLARPFEDMSSEQVESLVAEATRAARRPETP